jgi:hypothetical protein
MMELLYVCSENLVNLQKQKARQNLQNTRTARQASNRGSKGCFRLPKEFKCTPFRGVFGGPESVFVVVEFDALLKVYCLENTVFRCRNKQE